MKKTTIQAFHEEEAWRYEKYPEHDGRQRVEDRRAAALARFPHSLVAEGDWVEMDVVNRWVWRSFGPQDGPCYDYQSEYPACPQVLATEYVVGEGEDAEKEYKNPGATATSACGR